MTKEHFSIDLAGVHADHMPACDDFGGPDRLERQADTVRDVHHAAEGEDPKDDRGIEQCRRRRRDRAIAAADDARFVAFVDAASRELGRARRSRACPDPLQAEPGVAQDGLAAFEIAGSRGASTRRRIGNEHRARMRALFSHALFRCRSSLCDDGSCEWPRAELAWR